MNENKTTLKVVTVDGAQFGIYSNGYIDFGNFRRRQLVNVNGVMTDLTDPQTLKDMLAVLAMVDPTENFVKPSLTRLTIDSYRFTGLDTNVYPPLVVQRVHTIHRENIIDCF